MAEIVALAASVTAMVQAVEMLTKGSRKLYRLAKKIKAAKREIEDFASETQLFAGVIGAAHQALQQSIQSQGSDSPVLLYIQNSQAVENLRVASRRVVDDMQKLIPRLQVLRSQYRLWVRIRWVMQKAEVAAMGPRMESIKTSLLLIMSSISFEKGVQRELSAQGEDEVNALHEENAYWKNLVKGLVRTMRLQQEREREIRLHNLRYSSSETLDLQEPETQDALVRLGNSIVRRGTVPTTVPRPAARPAYTSTSTRRRSHHTANTLPREQHRRQQSRPRAPRPSESPVQASTVAREAEHHHTQSQVNAIPSASSTTVAGPSQSRAAPAPPIQPIDDFNSSRRYRITNSPIRDVQSVSGYIITPSGPRQVTSLLTTHHQDSLISQVFAVQLGLEITDERGTPVWFESEDGIGQKSAGQVLVQWSNGEHSHRKPLHINCLVYQHNIRTLVFGTNFIEERDRVWRRRRSHRS